MESKKDIEREIGKKVINSMLHSLQERKSKKSRWWRIRYWRLGNLSLSIGLQDKRHDISIGVDYDGPFLFWINLIIVGLEYEHTRDEGV
jgi:hypothetical protein